METTCPTDACGDEKTIHWAVCTLHSDGILSARSVDNPRMIKHFDGIDTELNNHKNMLELPGEGRAKVHGAYHYHDTCDKTVFMGRCPLIT